MSDLFGNHIVGFPTRRLKCFINADLLKCRLYLCINLSTGTTATVSGASDKSDFDLI